MAVYKFESCPKCGYRREEPEPQKLNKNCPKCGQVMRYADNWYVSFWVDGKKHQKSIGRNKDTAEAYYNKLKAMRQGRSFEPLSASWSETVAMFRQWFLAGNVKPKSAQMYEGCLKNLEPYFNKYALDEIEPSIVESYIKERQNRDAANASINREIATIRRLCNLSKSWGLIKENKIENVKLLEETPRARYLTIEEISKLLKECKKPYLRLIVLIALNTGLKKEHILNLQWHEIDFDAKTINKDIGKNEKVYIPMTMALTRGLSEYKQLMKRDSIYVFPSRIDATASMSDFKRRFVAACKNAGINGFTFNDLRNTFASQWLLATGDIISLSEILGVKIEYLATKYADIIKGNKVHSMAQFERIFTGDGHSELWEEKGGLPFS